MKGLRLTHKVVLFVLVAAVAEGLLMGGILHASGTVRLSYVLMAAGVGALLTGLVGLFVVRQVTGPLAQLNAAARRIGEGDLDTEVPVRSGDEIGQLAGSFRDMQGHLREMYADLERLVEERTAELQAANRLVESILESSTEHAIIAADAEWVILTFNEGARRTFGYEPAEIIGTSFERLVSEEEREDALGPARIEWLATRGRHEGEGVRVRSGGNRFPAWTATTVRRDAEGRVVGYTVICRDITRRKALEQRLREYTDNLEQMVAEKTGLLERMNEDLRRANQLKTQFLANMSHELRTPLAAIIGFAEAIRDGVPDDPTPAQRASAEDIYQAGQELLTLINSILDYSKLEAGAVKLDLQACDLGGIVDDVFRVIRSLAIRRGVALEADVVPRPFELTADPVKLKQILYNLLANGVKFTEKGGVVKVRARMEPETAVIRVIDTGIGIAPEDQVAIFEEFHQADRSLSRSHEGAGLGLALTRRLVELHGGDIVVESQLGRGTTFTVTLLRDIVSAIEM